MIIDPKYWHDISNEATRTYHYPDESTYTVVAPLELNIQTSSMGGHAHRIKTAVGGHYVRPGWNAISWIAPDGGFTF